MYDIFTTAALFFLLCPGVIVTLGMGPLLVGIIHAIVFFVLLQYASLYVPWFAVWIIAVVVVASKLYFGKTS